MSQHHRSTRRTSVIINLIKLPNGNDYMVENEKNSTTIQIPKQYAASKPPKQTYVNKTEQIPKKVETNIQNQQSVPIQQPIPIQMPVQQMFPQQQWQQPYQDKPETLLHQTVKARQPQKYALILPSCSAWFSMDSINQIEKDALPEYFQGQSHSKNPEIYKKQRNYIVNLYRNNPTTSLSATACRRVLAGDACGIMRIHHFLEHWGIINFSVDPEAFTAPKHCSITQSLKDELDDKIDELNNQEQLMVNTLKILSKNYRPLCDYCGIICGLVWFQQKPIGSEQVKEIVLCIKCFTNGNYPSILSHEDFQKTEIESKFEKTDILQKIQKQERVSSFSSDETQTMLQFLEERPDAKWEEITDLINQTHQVKRKPEEVMMHFLQLPFKNENIVFQQEETENYTVDEMLKRVAQKEPHVYSDYSNALTFHVALFKRLLRKYMKREQKQEDEEQKVELEVQQMSDPIKSKQEEQQEVKKYTFETSLGEKEYEVRQLQSKEDEKVKSTIEQIQMMTDEQMDAVQQLKDETVNRAVQLNDKEEEKMRNLSNLLISIQMEKLELKLQYLEEYEKLILYEKNQLEFCQKVSLAERLQIISQKLSNVE